MSLPKGTVSVPLLLGEKMRKYECKMCVPTRDKCILIVPDDLKEPERCPVDSMRAKWKQVVRLEVMMDAFDQAGRLY